MAASSETDLSNWSPTLDILLGVGLVLTALVIAMYIYLILTEKSTLLFPSVQFNNLKSAFIIPGFCIIAIFSICFPVIHGILDAIETLIEGLCIYSFFKMIEIYALNVKTTSIPEMISKSDHPVFNTCQRNHTLVCYRAMRFNIVIFMCIRPFFSLIAGLQEYLHWEMNIYVLFSILQLLTLVSAMVSLVRFYFSVEKEVASLGAALKVTFIKIYILVMVIQGFVVKKYTESNGGLNNSRYYNFVVIVESFFAACFFVPVFNQRILLDSTNISSINERLKSDFLAKESKWKEELIGLSNLQYVLAVLSPFGGPNYGDEIDNIYNARLLKSQDEKHVEIRSVVAVNLGESGPTKA